MYCDRVKQKLFPERPKSMERFCKKKNSDRLFIATAVVNQTKFQKQIDGQIRHHAISKTIFLIVLWTGQ
jgi:hypothetical protein